MTADEIASIIEGAAARHGVPTDALMAIANLESSGNIAAENPRSSASGLFQFVDSTANEYGLTGSKRNDPAAQADAAARMMATNARSLERTLGRPANAGELYLAHQQGLTGARALLTNPGRPAVDVLTGVYGDRNRAAQAVRLNGGNLNQSAGQFAGQWVNKANQRASLIPPGSVPNVVATQTDTQRPQQIEGRTNAPTSAASRQVPTNWFTPRLAPGNEQAYTYQIPDQTPTSVVGGLGSLTPDRAPPPLPRPRPGMPVVPYDRGQTVASVPTPQRQSLPPLPPSNHAPANLVSTTMDRANAAVDPGLQRALEQRNQRSMIDTSMQRTAAAVDPGLQRALEASGVGRPPATRSVASVPAPASPAMGITADRGAMPTRSAFLSEFGLANPRETLAAPLPTTAIPGPNNFAKGNERLLPPPRVQIAGLDAVPSAVPTVGTALDVVPNAGFPPMPRPRPVPFSMPTPMGQRPTLPMPRANPFAMPTPVAQRPNPNALRGTVNGAGSYNAPQRAPTPTREQMLAAIRARSRGPTAFGHGGTIDGAVQPIGTLSGRR
jgi:hypothetical protein